MEKVKNGSTLSFISSGKFDRFSLMGFVYKSETKQSVF